MDKPEALALLRIAINDPKGEFRGDQWEAIDQIVNERKKILIVERTGWGKSSVYFISTKILRDQGRGATIIISPLLALMRNQIEAAERLGIKAISINSSNYDDWDACRSMVLENKIDVLLISPERLANEKFMDEILRPIADNIGLFVVDEAHCISDWGHDFRPDYRRIVSILNFMPVGMPVLGTTATANNRVITDIISQLGDIEVLRGPLTRDSLVLQNIQLKNQASRLAWLKENIPLMPGSGVIYTLTKRDANQVTNWLAKCGIEAAAYYSGIQDDNFENSSQYREYAEDSLYNNDIKVLVATSALGMGYDKPDIGFVIHYQAPGSIISYYQQVGRAGRAIERAYGILLSGQEDEDIHEYFRRSAFPPEERIIMILDSLEESDGLSVPELMKRLNLRKGQIEHALKYLSVEKPSPVIKQGHKWRRTAVEFAMDTEKIARLNMQRLSEWEEVLEYINCSSCLMQFLQQALDDPRNKVCNKCANCITEEIFKAKVEHENEVDATLFLKRSEFVIKPRIKIEKDALPIYGLSGNINEELRAEVGKSLSRWGDAGWGEIVAEDKHANHFGDELVQAMKAMILDRWNPNPAPTWVTCVPSTKHPDLIPDFSRRLALAMNLPFHPIVNKIKENKPQKEQENSFYQCLNLDGVFEIHGEIINEPVLLIDDAIDSGWTITIISVLLRLAGSGVVYPAVLTSTAVK